MIARGAAPGVCFVTDRTATAGRPLMDVANAVIGGGADCVQVREKDMAGGPLLRLARGIVEAARAAGGRCQVVINDRLDVALAARAAGVHLPADGLAVDAVRGHAGRRFLVGRSVHSLAEARQAEKAGADYLFFGPIFETPSKMRFGPPQGTAALIKLVGSVRIPVWAIGGVNPATAAELRGIHLAGIAAISAIAAAPEPGAVVRELRAALVGVQSA